jgi:hypothetical protein
MITVYLLGHRVGDIEEPVLYVKHKSYNYDGIEVTKGIPDPFIDSLVHDSIIVQIPLLRGTINNRLDKVLSVFDQSHKDEYNHQILNFDDDAFKDDAEMLHILHRLLAAAADARLRQDMNVEDEYFSAIEDRDTAIMIRDKEIAKRDAKLAEQETILANKDDQLAEKDKALLSSAKALKEAGLQVKQIAEMTKLPEDVINQL